VVYVPRLGKSKLVKNIGYRIRLRPIASRLNDFGLELPEIDDDWIVQSAGDDGIVIANVRTQHQFTLGYDHVHHFTSDTTRRQGELKFGFLTLTVQIYLQRANLSIQPAFRPGERVPPPAVKVTEKIVDFRYPSDSGIQATLQAQGFKVSWALESRLYRLVEFEGWQRVIIRDNDGALVQFKVKDRRDDQVLVFRPA
jgi:hypothetical protein